MARDSLAFPCSLALADRRESVLKREGAWALVAEKNRRKNSPSHTLSFSLLFRPFWGPRFTPYILCVRRDTLGRSKIFLIGISLELQTKSHWFIVSMSTIDKTEERECPWQNLYEAEEERTNFHNFRSIALHDGSHLLIIAAMWGYDSAGKRKCALRLKIWTVRIHLLNNQCNVTGSFTAMKIILHYSIARWQWSINEAIMYLAMHSW